MGGATSCEVRLSTSSQLDKNPYLYVSACVRVLVLNGTVRGSHSFSLHQQIISVVCHL